MRSCLSHSWTGASFCFSVVETNTTIWRRPRRKFPYPKQWASARRDSYKQREHSYGRIGSAVCLYSPWGAATSLSPLERVRNEQWVACGRSRPSCRCPSLQGQGGDFFLTVTKGLRLTAEGHCLRRAQEREEGRYWRDSLFVTTVSKSQ